VREALRLLELGLVLRVRLGEQRVDDLGEVPVRRRVPGTSRELADDVVTAVGRLRAADVQKPPGIAEGIDWVAALELLGAERLGADAADRTLGSVLKYREDQESVRAAGLERLVGGGA